MPSENSGGSEPSAHPSQAPAAASSGASGTPLPSGASETNSGDTRTPSSNENESSKLKSTAAAVSRSKIELADFIYRDQTRINSLYSQLFNGLLLNSETSKATKDATERGLGLSAVVTGAIKEGWEEAIAVKENRQPHDAITGDLIVSLGALDRISNDVVNAKPGTIVRAIGELFLIDRYLVKSSISTWAENENLDKDTKSTIKKLMKMIADEIDVPNAFVLRTEQFCVAGTLGTSGLSEPITAAYFKHGVMGMEDVGVIGIKETSGSPPPDNFSKAGAFSFNSVLVSGGLRKALFPKEALLIAPIIIFRNVH